MTNILEADDILITTAFANTFNFSLKHNDATEQIKKDFRSPNQNLQILVKV